MLFECLTVVLNHKFVCVYSGFKGQSFQRTAFFSGSKFVKFHEESITINFSISSFINMPTLLFASSISGTLSAGALCMHLSEGIFSICNLFSKCLKILNPLASPFRLVTNNKLHLICMSSVSKNVTRMEGGGGNLDRSGATVGKIQN